MRMGQGVRTALGHGGITCVLQTQFSSFQIFTSLISQASLSKNKCDRLIQSTINNMDAWQVQDVLDCTQVLQSSRQEGVLRIIQR